MKRKKEKENLIELVDLLLNDLDSFYSYQWIKNYDMILKSHQRLTTIISFDFFKKGFVQDAISKIRITHSNI